MGDDNLVTTETNRADAADRAAKAWKLRVAGASWEEVARMVGYGNASNAYRAVKNYFGQVPQIDREMLRGMARARGEMLWLRALQQVERTEGAPAAIRAAVAVLERHARLDGLDAPTKVDVNGPDPLEFERFVRLAAIGAGLSIPEEADIFEDIEDAEVVGEP